MRRQVVGPLTLATLLELGLGVGYGEPAPPPEEPTSAATAATEQPLFETDEQIRAACQDKDAWWAQECFDTYLEHRKLLPKEWNADKYKRFIARFNQISRGYDVNGKHVEGKGTNYYEGSQPFPMSASAKDWKSKQNAYPNRNRPPTDSSWRLLNYVLGKDLTVYIAGAGRAAEKYRELKEIGVGYDSFVRMCQDKAEHFFPESMGETRFSIEDVVYVYLGYDERKFLYDKAVYLMSLKSSKGRFDPNSADAKKYLPGVSSWNPQELRRNRQAEHQFQSSLRTIDRGMKKNPRIAFDGDRVRLGPAGESREFFVEPGTTREEWKKAEQEKTEKARAEQTALVAKAKSDLVQAADSLKKIKERLGTSPNAELLQQVQDLEKRLQQADADLNAALTDLSKAPDAVRSANALVQDIQKLSQVLSPPGPPAPVIPVPKPPTGEAPASIKEAREAADANQLHGHFAGNGRLKPPTAHLAAAYAALKARGGAQSCREIKDAGDQGLCAKIETELTNRIKYAQANPAVSFPRKDPAVLEFMKEHGLGTSPAAPAKKTAPEPMGDESLIPVPIPQGNPLVTEFKQGSDRGSIKRLLWKDGSELTVTGGAEIDPAQTQPPCRGKDGKMHDYYYVLPASLKFTYTQQGKTYNVEVMGDKIICPKEEPLDLSWDIQHQGVARLHIR